MTGNVQTNGKAGGKFGHPPIYDKFDKKREYVPGFDFSQDFHVFGFDWRGDDPVLVAGRCPAQADPLTNACAAGESTGHESDRHDFCESPGMKADERQWIT